MAATPRMLRPAAGLSRTPFVPSSSSPRSSLLMSAAPGSRRGWRANAGVATAATSSSAQLLSADAIHRDEVLHAVKISLPHCLSETHLDLTVPGLRATSKGKVLNETSMWWFNQTQDITANATVCTPDRNVTIARKCSIFPVEFVVRGFVTGSTETSLWTVYSKGVRSYCGNILPDGMTKNQKLPANILTPTTKGKDHDVPVTPKEVIELGLMTPEEYDEASSKALKLFAYGQKVALENGLLLVDTKYEFGKGADGKILLIDEVHTPDSSRYWIADSYEDRFCNGLEPVNVDKEFLRLWFRDHCNPYEDKVLPKAPEDLICELAWRYIFLFETITKSKFEITLSEESIHDRISRNVAQALSDL